MTVNHIAIIGAGLAGVNGARELRNTGFNGTITLINGESHAPYDRPPLSKNVLINDSATVPLLESDDWYQDNQINRRDSAWVTEINADCEIMLKDGDSLQADRIILATGSRPRRLALLEAADIHAFYIRNVEDAYALREHLRPGLHLGVVGAGFIGLEVAANARTLGLDVTVFESAPAVLGRVLTSKTGSFIAARHRSAGVTIKESTSITSAVSHGTHGARLTLNDKTCIEVDLIVVGIGSLANDALCATAGIESSNGILVDEQARTSVPTIYAVGDCARYPCPWRGSMVRCEQWKHACEHARFAARTILGVHERYSAIPWFWSDQYEMSIQLVGHTDTLSHVERQTKDGLVIFHLDNGSLRGATFINQPRLRRLVTKLIEENIILSPDKLANPDFDLKTLIAP